MDRAGRPLPRQPSKAQITDVHTMMHSIHNNILVVHTCIWNALLILYVFLNH